MTKYQKKLTLLKDTPNCPVCGCKMIVKKEHSNLSHAAIIVDDKLMCYKCRRTQIKEGENFTNAIFQKNEN